MQNELVRHRMAVRSGLGGTIVMIAIMLTPITFRGNTAVFALA